MRVLHINSYYGTSIFYKNLYDVQKENGLDIDVYVYISTSYNIPKLSLGEYTVLSRSYGYYDRYIFHLKHIKVLKDIQRKLDIKNYNIIHAHSLFSNGYIAYKLNKKYNIPYIVAVRNTDVNLFFSKMIFLRKLGVKILINSQKIIFISNSYKKHTINQYIPIEFREGIERKTIVLPNGIDRFWLDNKFIAQMKPKEKTIGLVYAGQINYNKNIETTITACELLIARGYKLTYSIIGKMMDERYIKLMKRYPFIKYIPHSPRGKLLEYYRDSDIFVMPSRHETFGLVYAEAMSQGLPVIYTRGQGFDGQFDEGEVGYSVQYNSPEEIAEKVIKIINNYEAISQNCINKVDKFNWDKIAEKYIEIYNSLNNII